jgi:hypothetical protein
MPGCASHKTVSVNYLTVIFALTAPSQIFFAQHRKINMPYEY